MSRRSICLAIHFFAIALSIGTANAAKAECAHGVVEVRLPAQRLDQRLQELSHLTGCFVEAPPALIKGKRASAIAGRVPADQAFFRSVRGTGLEAGLVQNRWRISRDQQEYFARRIANLKRRMAAQSHAGLVGERMAKQNGARLDAVMLGVNKLILRQGFLSAAEQSSYTATLDNMDRAIPR